MKPQPAKVEKDEKKQWAICVTCFLSDPSYKDRNETILARDKCPNNEIRFKEQLMSNSWFQLEGINDPKTAYKTFFNKFSEIYNSCFPLKKIRIRRGFRSKLWLSNGLLNSIKKKNKLYKKFLQNPTPQSETFYKTYKNKLNHSLRISKRLYYEKKLENCKSNNRATWKLLLSISHNFSKHGSQVCCQLANYVSKFGSWA